MAATWRWRCGELPPAGPPVGPSGSGKSTFAPAAAGVDAASRWTTCARPDGLALGPAGQPRHSARGAGPAGRRARAGGTVVWDATSLNQQQRSLVQAVARRRDALITHAVFWSTGTSWPGATPPRHPVPPEVLAAQLRRFGPPYPGEAHRTCGLNVGHIALVL